MAASSADPDFPAVLAAGVRAQQIVSGAIAVGGTAAALYARHRFSRDTDHLVPDLSSRFADVREALERQPGWKTARVQPPVLILGSIDGIEVGFRHPRRTSSVQTRIEQTPQGPLTLPTLDELLGMKAYMACSRNAVRDYVDFAALSELAGDEATMAALLKSNVRYGQLQSHSVMMSIAGCLVDPRPFDASFIELSQYKGLIPRWQSWDAVAAVCRSIGKALTVRLFTDESS